MAIVIEFPRSAVDTLLRTAIQQKRMIRLRYGGKERIVEPHDYGIQNGCLRLLTYQVGGASNHKLPNWRWMDVDQMSDLELLDRTFAGRRPSPAGNHHHWDHLLIRVTSAQS